MYPAERSNKQWLIPAGSLSLFGALSQLPPSASQQPLYYNLPNWPLLVGIMGLKRKWIYLKGLTHGDGNHNTRLSCALVCDYICVCVCCVFSCLSFCILSLDLLHILNALKKSSLPLCACVWCVMWKVCMTKSLWVKLVLRVLFLFYWTQKWWRFYFFAIGFIL